MSLAFMVGFAAFQPYSAETTFYKECAPVMFMIPLDIG
jgi:hypothetical protein